MLLCTILGKTPTLVLFTGIDFGDHWLVIAKILPKYIFVISLRKIFKLGLSKILEKHKCLTIHDVLMLVEF